MRATTEDTFKDTDEITLDMALARVRVADYGTRGINIEIHANDEDIKITRAEITERGIEIYIDNRFA